MEIVAEPVTLEPEAAVEPLEAESVTVTLAKPTVRSRGRPKGAPNKPRVQVIPEAVPVPLPMAQPRPKRALRAVAAMTREVPPEPAPPASLGDMLAMLAQAISQQKSNRSQQRRAMYQQFLA